MAHSGGMRIGKVTALLGGGAFVLAACGSSAAGAKGAAHPRSAAA